MFKKSFSTIMVICIMCLCVVQPVAFAANSDVNDRPCDTIYCNSHNENGQVRVEMYCKDRQPRKMEVIVEYLDSRDRTIDEKTYTRRTTLIDRLIHTDVKWEEAIVWFIVDGEYIREMHLFNY